jgi:DNA invertase Pin-like site-specific DNA recombinase
MKAIIYLRTSTKEQNPELQKQECLTFAKSRGYEVIEVLQEKLSGFKEIERPHYELIKERAHKGEIQAVIVWALDRWVRNRDTLLEDVTTLRNNGVKLHSVKEAWLEAINLEGPLGKTIQEFLLGIIGTQGEMESKRKSERMVMAHQNYKGDKWGRPSLGLEVDNQITELFNQGKSMRAITNEVAYWDKNRNKRFVSLGYVHKIVSDFKRKSFRLETVQQKGN